MLHSGKDVCARYFTMLPEGPARTWFINNSITSWTWFIKNLPENSITSWTDLRKMFIKNFKGTCRQAMTIVDLAHCVQKEGESALSWARRVADIIHSSDTISMQITVI